MRNFFRAYFPFLIYSVCVATAYFIFFYIIPKYAEVLFYFTVFIIYSYTYLGVLFFGYFMGRVTARRMVKIKIFPCLIYAIISFFIMLPIGTLSYIFFECLYGPTTLTFSFFMDYLRHFDALYVAIGTFIPFLIGEIVEYIKVRFDNNTQ